VDQAIEQSGWTLSFPVGVFVDALGDETVGDALDRPNGLARVDMRYGDVSVEVASTCAFPCETPRYHVAAHVQPAPRLRAWYAAGNMDIRGLSVAWADLHVDQPLTALRLVQTRGDTGASTQFAHRAGVRYALGRASFGVGGNWGQTDASRGVEARVAWDWRELGWGLGIGGGWRPIDDTWGVLAGLKWSYR
jgi:hypothetical protein